MNLKRQKWLDRGLGIPILLLLKPMVVIAGLILRRDHHLPDPKLKDGGTITVLKMLGGGSLVIALPALLGIRRQYPKSTFQLVTTPAVAPFAKTLGVFDEIKVVHQKNVVSLVATAIQAIAKSFRSRCFVDLEVYSKLSTVFSVLTCSHNRIGFYLENVVWRKPIHTHLIFFNRYAPVHLFYERAALLLGAEPATFEECQSTVASACTLPTEKRGNYTIALGAGCSSLGQERMFSPVEWLSIFKRQFQARPDLRTADFLFLGGKEDAALANEVIERAKSELAGVSFKNLCGELALVDSLRTLRTSHEFWGIDSSLLHYARLLGLKCISFWGPTAPFTRLKKFPIVEEVHYRAIPCSPCVHVAEFPPCNGNNLCMKSLVNEFSDETLEKQLPVFLGAADL